MMQGDYRSENLPFYALACVLESNLKLTRKAGVER